MKREQKRPDAEREETSHAGVMQVLQSKEEIRSYYNQIARVYDLLAERTEDPMRWAGFELLGPTHGREG
jgi:hypothetical protein